MTLKGFIEVSGLCIGGVVLGLTLLYGIVVFATYMSTTEGNFVIIPETGQSFDVRKVVFVSANTVAYVKPDGTGGRISGNFRVEDAPKVIEK